MLGFLLMLNLEKAQKSWPKNFVANQIYHDNSIWTVQRAFPKDFEMTEKDEKERNCRWIITS